MSTNFITSAPYLKTSRNFPLNPQELQVELDKSYIDIASAVNNRTIGVFSTNYASINGEGWFITSKKQQGLRKVYNFTSLSTFPIPHNLDYDSIERFTRLYGTYTDGTNWYGIIGGTSVAIAGQFSFYVTPTTLTFLTGAGAPAMTRGSVVIEWLSKV
jgi:hypothetical protein